MRSARRGSTVLAFTAFVVLASLASCSDKATDQPTCVTVDTSCSPLYEPTYEQLFGRTFKPTCAASGVSCHANTGRQGGISFEDADDAYAALNDGRRIRPGDAACSELVVRVMSTDGKIRMPPGKSLDPAIQCAIIQWVQAGAKR